MWPKKSVQQQSCACPGCGGDRACEGEAGLGALGISALPFLVTLWGGKGFSQVPISPADMELLDLTPCLLLTHLSTAKKITPPVHSGWKLRAASLLTSEGFVS